VGNMIGQHGIRSVGKQPPIRYSALDQCLQKVNDFCLERDLHVFMPQFGSGLAGGEWGKVEELINLRLTVPSTCVRFNRR
jgi:hypothetical protein